MKKQESTITLYHAVWCPHCVQFMDKWKELTKRIDELNKSGKYNIKYQSKEEKDMSSAESQLIQGFPTIKINGKTYEGPRSVDSILKELTKQSGGGMNNYYRLKYNEYKNKYLHFKNIFK